MSAPLFWRIGQLSHFLQNVQRAEAQKQSELWIFSIFALFCFWRKIKLLTFFIPWWWAVWNETYVCLSKRALASIIKFFFLLSYTVFLSPLVQIPVLTRLMSIWHALHQLHAQSTPYGPPAITRWRHFSFLHDHIHLWHKWMYYHFYTYFGYFCNTFECLMEMLLLLHVCGPGLCAVSAKVNFVLLPRWDRYQVRYVQGFLRILTFWQCGMKDLILQIHSYNLWISWT